MNEMGREYAEALFAIACEENSKNEYAQALNTVSEAFAEAPEYMDLLICPSVPVTERISALEEAFSGQIPEHVLHFLMLLCEKGRMRLLGSCIKEYGKLLDASDNTAETKVTSAVELTDDEKKRIVQKLEKLLGKSVVAEYITDPSIMGGVVIETEGRVIDGSLRRHLHEVKEVIGR
ncbi:MAG: ATP synthase F1 subunit delta [Ruminococcus sp.]|nr:ATP synthase F1 subunit delta [Ruminococcus sp.]